jgi:hypothetical protein
MMVAVDETRQQDFLAGAEDGRIRIAPLQRLIGAGRNDDAVLLQHRAVGDLVPTVTIDRARNHGAAADQGRSQDVFLP